MMSKWARHVPLYCSSTSDVSKNFNLFMQKITHHILGNAGHFESTTML